MNKIAKGLEADGILTGAGKTKWWTSTINKILRNEKYIGDALLQKTYTTDFLNKTRVKNNGIVPQYYVEENHEAIIPKDIFLRVQEELVRRRVVLQKANNKEAYDEIADQIFKLREQREKCTVDIAARDAQIARINELQDFIKQQRTDLVEFNEALVKRWLKQITVWEDHFTVELKSGLKIDIEG